MILTMGNMAFAQVVTCSLTFAGGIPAVNAAPNVSEPAPGPFAPLGASARSGGTEHTAPIGAGPTSQPPMAGGGKVRITCVNADPNGVGPAPVSPGVVVLTFSTPVPITNTQTHPTTAAGIRIVNGTGAFFAPGPGTGTVVGANVGINAVNNNGGQITIGLGTTAGGGNTCTGMGCTNPTTGVTFPAGSSSSFDLDGVLVSTNGRTGGVSATLSSSGGISIGTGSLEVITAVLASITDPTVATGSLPAAVTGLPNAGPTVIAGGPAVLNSAGGVVKSNFTLRIQENYADAFKEASQYNRPNGPLGVTDGVFPNSPASDTQLSIILSNIPNGFTIANCSAVLTDTAGAATAGAPTISATNITAASPILTVNFNALIDQTAVDVLWVVCTNIAAGSAVTPLPSTPITAQVTMSPTGLAVSAGPGNPALTGLTTGQIPRYQQALVPSTPVTLVLFPPSNTVLLVNFAFVGPGYNTGIAVANTTVDPFTPAGGGAAPSEGTVSFLLVKNDGTSRTYTTTTGSPGSGLTGAGIVKSGSTYVVNLSELLAAANYGTSFTGYVFVTANFTFAHGAATIYTTSNGAAALSSPVVVLVPVSTAAPRGTPESAGQ
jgi:hypothetical protein